MQQGCEGGRAAGQCSLPRSQELSGGRAASGARRHDQVEAGIPGNMPAPVLRVRLELLVVHFMHHNHCIRWLMAGLGLLSGCTKYHTFSGVLCLDGCCNLFCLLNDIYLSKPPCLEPQSHRLPLQCTVCCVRTVQLIMPIILVCCQQLLTDVSSPASLFLYLSLLHLQTHQHCMSFASEWSR